MQQFPSRILVALFLGTLLSWAGVVRAQGSPSASEIATARQEFMAGVQAARFAQWQEALERFERSYALYPHPKTLFNIAGAHRQLGHVVTAAEAYRKFLRSPPDDDAEERAQAEAALRELEPQLPVVTLEVQGIAPDDRVLLDGVPINPAVLSAQMPVDPGGHVLVVERANAEVARQEFRIEPGSRATVVAAVPPEPEPTVATPAEAARTIESAPPDDARLTSRVDTSVRARRIWIATGVSVVVAGAVAAILWASLRDDGVDAGNLGGTTF